MESISVTTRIKSHPLQEFRWSWRSYQAKPARFTKMGISHFYTCVELGVGNGQEGRRGLGEMWRGKGREKRMKKGSKKGWVHSKDNTYALKSAENNTGL